MNKEREIIKLTEEEFSKFDHTKKEGLWHLRDETYEFVEIITTDHLSDNESWDTIVKRHSDGKYFRWEIAHIDNKWCMGFYHNKIEEVFPRRVTFYD